MLGDGDAASWDQFREQRRLKICPEPGLRGRKPENTKGADLSTGALCAVQIKLG